LAYLIFWPLVLWALFSRRPVALFLFFAVIPFGSVSVVPTELTGGLTILPRMICGPVLALRILMRPGGLTDSWAALSHVRRLGLLSLFMLIAVIVTLFAPRLFLGAIEILGVSTARVEVLRPTGTNISQLIYLFASYVMVLALFLAMKTKVDRQRVVMALLLGGVVTVATGLLDVATHGTKLLAPLRTAAYSMLTGQEVLGSQRIVGLMPEASAFSAVCIFFGATLYFLRSGITLDRRWSAIYMAVVGANLLFAALSTASTGLLGLGAFGGIVAIDWTRRLLGERTHDERVRIFQQFSLAGAALLVIAILMVLRPEIFKPMIDMIDTAIFKKTSSDSFTERSMWNRVGMQALVDSYGFGVGVGSTRTSSWPVAILASTGVVGAIVMGAFLVQRFTLGGKGLDDAERRMLTGAKLALIVVMVPGAVAGTLVDFGPLNAVLFAMTAALGASHLADSPRGRRRESLPSANRRAPLVSSRRGRIGARTRHA
jgi:hypothetical protein